MKTSRAPSTAGAETLTVAAVQFRSELDLLRNAARIAAVLAECARKGVEIAAFPECALTSYTAEAISRMPGNAIAEAENEVARACARHRIAALVGTAGHANGKSVNAALVISRTGRIRARYLKEYLVGRDRAWRCVAGDRAPPVFPIGRTKASVTICHDNRYPEVSRLPVLAGARVMFHLSHEGDLTKRAKLGPSRAQMQARAVENGVFVVHANAPSDGGARGSHGESRIVAPDGNILLEASQRGEEILIAELDLRLATRRFALNSLRGPHRDWWRAGVRKVPVLRSRL